MKKWNIKKELTLPAGRQGIKKQELRIDEIIELLLANRGLTTKKEREGFLRPRLEDITPKSVGIDAKQLKKTLARIKKAIEKKEQIVVFGDYDVDGITGTAILWERLYGMKANVVPYIPHRIDEGYGLSKKGISNILRQLADQNVSLIITVDNGIVANEAVEFANSQGIDVIITDHHTIGKKLPDAHAIVHTIKLCGAGVAYVLSKELKNTRHPEPFGHPEQSEGSQGRLREGSLPASRQATAGDSSASPQNDKEEDDHLELAALGTVADMVPLVGANRAIVKYGIEKLSKTKRPGIKELCKAAGLAKDVFGVYEIGFIIAPRLNATGRIEHAMDSVRLLCTKDPARARMLAEKLELTNRERQLLLRQSAEHAISEVRSRGTEVGKLVIVAHEAYPEGVIGLVAGKLVETFYRPAIVIAKGEKMSKASARSIAGFNIIEFFRTIPDSFVNVGGHPMAAGFTVETEKILILQEALQKLANNTLNDGDFVRNLNIDFEIPLSLVTMSFYNAMQQLAPFGIGNPEPVFVSRGVIINNTRIIGKDANHLKLSVHQENAIFNAIGFRMAELAADIHTGDRVDIAYTVNEDTWNGVSKLQLKLKDIKKTN